MRTLRTPTKVAFCALALFLSGCWMGGNTRSSYRPSSPNPTPPIINSPQYQAPRYHAPQYGPTTPLPPGQPAGPVLEGPVIEGPAFPQSSAGDSPGCGRPRPAQNWRDEESRRNFAGTSPPTIIPDGPIAIQWPKTPQRTIGYIELPPAP